MIALFFTLVLSPSTPAQEWLTETSSSFTSSKEAWIALKNGELDKALQLLPPPEQQDELEQWMYSSALVKSDPKRAYRNLPSIVNSRCLSSEHDLPRIALLGLKADLLTDSRPLIAAKILAAINTSESLAKAIHLIGTNGLSRNWTRWLLLRYASSTQAKNLIKDIGLRNTLKIFDDIDSQLNLLEALLDAHENQLVIDLGNTLKPDISTAASRCRWGYLIGKAHRKIRNYSESLAELQNSRSVCIQGFEEGAWDIEQLTMRVALLEARLLAIKGRGPELIALAEWMKTFSPNHSYIDDVLYWAARNLPLKQSEQILNQIIAINNDQAPIAAWHLAVNAMLSDNSELSIKWLRTLLDMRNISIDDRERAEYFLGRAELNSSQATPNGVSRWEALARRPSFYGFLALSRLKKHAPLKAQKVENSLKHIASSTTNQQLVTKILNHPSAIKARKWFAIGATDWALAELRSVKCVTDLRKADNVITLASLFDVMGAYPDAQHLLRRPSHGWLNAPLSSKTLVRWKLAYSRPFADAFIQAATSEDLDPLLLTAVAREESTFDPNIVSWAGAVGLAQLMPTTASEAFKSIYGGQLDLSLLKTPSLNLRLGARVLKRNLKVFHNGTAFALAGYNSGTGRVRHTLPRKETPFEDWIESTRVQETQAYIKRVTATWAIYRLLHGENREIPRLPRTVGPGPKRTF